jgi:hypothetical protein
MLSHVPGTRTVGKTNPAVFAMSSYPPFTGPRSYPVVWHARQLAPLLPSPPFTPLVKIVAWPVFFHGSNLFAAITLLWHVVQVTSTWTVSPDPPVMIPSQVPAVTFIGFPPSDTVYTPTLSATKEGTRLEALSNAMAAPVGPVPVQAFALSWPLFRYTRVPAATFRSPVSTLAAFRVRDTLEDCPRPSETVTLAVIAPRVSGKIGTIIIRFSS